MISRDTERYGELSEKDVCDIYEIFKPHEKCPDPRVVLLEGDPGIGKTVCCKKIAFDWSKDKTGEPFPRFKILIKLKCRDINPRALIAADILKEAIADQRATRAEKCIVRLHPGSTVPSPSRLGWDG